MNSEEAIQRRKALLDALLPDDELRHLWLTHADFYNAVNLLTRLLPVWIDSMADRAKSRTPLLGLNFLHAESSQEVTPE